MAVCLRCGKQLNATAKFCGSCGYPVKIQQTAYNQGGSAASPQQKTIVCLRCGKQLRTDAKFCGGCGYPTQRPTRNQQTTTNNQAGKQEARQQTTTANNTTGNTVPPQTMTREQLIAEIDRMLVYFSKKQDLYDEYDKCVNIRNAEQEKIERDIIRRRHSDSLLDDPDAISNFLLSVSVTALIAIPFILQLVDKPKSIFISIGCFLLSSSIIFLLVWLSIQSRKEKKKLKNRMNSMLVELKEHHRNYGNCLVSVNNANPRVLRKVRDYLVMGKANTLKEALILACN